MCKTCRKNLSNDFIPHLSCTACVFLLTKAFLFVYHRLMAGVWARIANVSNMDVKFLAMLDPNCRLNFPKSGKLVALLFLPDALHLSFFILLSILFIITNCGLQSHAGLEGLQLFTNCGSYSSPCKCSKKVSGYSQCFSEKSSHVARQYCLGIQLYWLLLLNMRLLRKPFSSFPTHFC